MEIKQTKQVRIDLDLHHKVKGEAFKRGKLMDDFLSEIIRDFFEKEEKKKILLPRCLRCNDNGCPACDSTEGSKYNPEPY